MPITIAAREPAPTAAPIQGEAQLPAIPEAKPEIPQVAPEAKKDELLSPRYAQLARKEKALRQQQQLIQKEKEELKAKLAEYESSYVPKSKLNELAKNNPLLALEQLGVTPDEFTQALLNANPQDAAIQKIMQRIEAIENGQKQTLSTIEQQQKNAYDQALTQIRMDLKSTADSDPRFETIKEADARGWEATEGAVALIETIFNEGWPEKKIPKGTVIQNDQALSYVQDWVKEKAYEMAQLKGVKEKFAPAPVETKPEEKPAPQAGPVRAAAKTLTNQMNASKTTRLSASERRARAIAAFTGQLT